MKTYRVFLHRDYLVEITAQEEGEARQLAEYFLSHPQDLSTRRDREVYGFKIGEIEMATNEATGVAEIIEEK